MNYLKLVDIKWCSLTLPCRQNGGTQSVLQSPLRHASCASFVPHLAGIMPPLVRWLFGGVSLVCVVLPQRLVSSPHRPASRSRFTSLCWHRSSRALLLFLRHISRALFTRSAPAGVGRGAQSCASRFYRSGAHPRPALSIF